jgi:excisionase family DNA binding protein
MSIARAGLVDRVFNQADARQLLGGISRSTLYRLIQAGHIRPVKIGRRLMIPASEIERLAVEGTR